MTLENFQKASSFLRAQGIEPTLDMLRLEPGEWSTLLDLVCQWESQVSQHQQAIPTDEELELERKQEAEKDLYWSAT